MTLSKSTLCETSAWAVPVPKVSPLRVCASVVRALLSHRITIENCRLPDSDATGAYVDGYVTDVRLRNLEVANSDGPGIYLKAGSADNQIKGCDIDNNGDGDVTPDGVYGMFLTMLSACVLQTRYAL